ncbi:MAG: hypothetical protein QOH16_2472, partial [Gaiellaceae bacterium]|nr:hypothetical protein [Gaiellaceae bacterium]
MSRSLQWRRNVLRGALLALIVVAALTLRLSSGAATLTDPCSSPGWNVITCENSKTGAPSTAWSTGGAGDTTLQGFATEISVDHGQTVSFKITDTNGGTGVGGSYHIDIYRVGYYQGNGARLQATIPSASATKTAQAACLKETTTGLTDCGNWTVSATWAVPATAVSGLYFANLVRDTTGANSHIYFVVRDDERHAPVLFQTSDETWQAYNAYGGNSLYVGTAPTSNGRAYKVSYNRPLTTGNNSQRNEPMYAEYPMIRFLEKNGFDVSYFTDVDTARSGAEILNHKAFLSVGHDEYWSGEQRANATAARDAGVNLAFFSGNEIFWKTRFASSISGGAQAWRTVVCYKESKETTVPIDPADPPTSTGTWRDPRFGSPSDGAKPENALSGQFFMVDAIRDDAIAIPYAYSQLRFWSNTSISRLTPGQTATLPTGTLGYEWDSDLDNGSRPRGLIDMSSTTVPVTTLVTDSTGQAEGSGNATHHLTLYRAPSGALVFGAGTVQWPFGLDDQHTQVQDSSNPPANADMQQATVNLLADMGTQPATLATGLVAATQSTDTTPPTSTISYPTPTTLLNPTQSVTATGTATDTGGVVGGVEVSVDGGTTWHPATGTTNWSYTFVPGSFGQISIQSRATDDSANVQTTPTSVTVPVGACPCNIFGQVTPTNTSVADPNPYELGVKFRSDVAGFINGIRFYKGSGNTGSHVGHLWTSSGTLLATATFTGETATGWQQVTFASPVAINPNTTYVASYFTASGNYAADRPFFAAHSVDVPPLHALADGTDGPNGVYASGGGFPTSSFQASNYYVDVIFNNSNPPTVNTVTPAANAVGVAASATPTVAFSQPMSPATIDNTTITVRDPANTLVPATVTYDAASMTATLTPNQPLALSTAYTATVTGGASGVKNANGTPLAADFTWTFTTATPLACPCTIFPASATPSTASSFDTTANELGVKFRSDENGYIRGIRFYKGPGNTGTHVGHLWSSSGAMLAAITFANETAGGWQQVNFASPVAITANTTYIASYFAPNGGYALDRPYFNTGVDRSPLHALADAVSGPNGVFSAGGGFPTQGANMSNYWVDAVFDTSGSDLTPPVVASVSPAGGATGIATSRAVTVAFDEPVDPLSITTTNVGLRNPSNAVVPSTVSYDSARQSATLTPNAPLALSTTYTVVVKGGTGGVSDTSGNALASDYTSTFVTGTPAACPCNLLGSATPTLASTSDASPTEVGVKFRSDVDGYVTGLRFYKGAQNTGTHVGHLWTVGGTLLGSATFTGETSTGWQQVSFATAIAVSANTTYVASYFAPNGSYALDRPYFSSWLDRSPLHALAEGVDGSNGVYAPGQAFPNLAFDGSASNYWVDPVFDTVPTQTPPAVNATSPAPNATGVSQTTTVTAVFSELLDPASVSTSSFALHDASGATVPSTVTYDSATTTATLTPSAPLTPGATYTATISSGSGGPRNSGGAALESDVSWSFTISADTTAPITTIACNAGGCANWFGTSPVTVALSASDNSGGSGLATTKYTIDGSDPTTSASAAVYTGSFTVTTTTTVRYSSTDKAGNVEAPGSTQVRIDTTPPSAPSLSFGAFSNASGSGSTVYFNPALTGGFTVTASAPDAESGIASVNYPTLGSGWTRTGGAYTFAAGAVDPVEPNNVSVANNAGLTSAATSFSVTADGTAPATVATCNGSVCPDWSTSSPVSVALGATDGGSGVAATYYTTDGSDPSVVHGTLYLGAFTVAVTTTVKFRSYDNVGNAAGIGSQLVQVDTTPPSTPALVLTETSPFEYGSGSTLYYSPTGTNGGTFTAGATTADAESGISKVTFPAVTGMTGGGDVLSGPYQTTYSWSAPTATSGGQTVTARNAAGLTASSAFTLTPDTLAPSGGSIVYADGYTATGSIAITTTNGSDAGAGLDTTSGVLQRDSAPLANGTCAAFPGTWTTASSPDTTLVSATCYRYRYLISDNVGNKAIYTSTSVVKADSTAPSTPTLTLTSTSATQFIVGTTIYYGNTSAGTFTVAAVSADAESGIKQVTFPALTGMTGGGADTSSPYQGTYNWATSTTLSGAQNVNATNNANLTSGNAPFTVTLDATAPTLSITSPVTGAKLRNGAVLTPSVSDGGSGMKQVEFRYCTGTANCNFNSATSIGTATAAPFTVTWNSQPADGSYTIVARATDNVGNTTATAPASGTQVILDNTVPLTALSLVGTTASYLSGGTIYFGNTAGAFSLHIDVLDPQPASGVKNVVFPAIATTGWTGAAATDISVPYENAYTFPAAAATPAAKTITTSDNAGNLQNDTVTFVKDQTAPSVTLTAPATGAKLRNGATVGATAADAGAGIRQVEFRYCPGTTCTFASGTTIGTATSAPYSVSWNSEPADGTYTIAVQATDNVGNTATDGTATVTLDNSPPATALTVAGGTRPDLQYFAAGTLYYNPAGSGDFTVSETATDPNGVASVAFPAIAQTGFNGPAKTSVSTPYVSNTYAFGPTNVTAPPPATVVSTDAVGNSRSDSLLFVLDNTAPAGGSIGYTNGYAAGGTVAISTALGTDPGAGIAPATAVLERQVAALAGDTCGTFGAWTTTTSPDTLASAACARYRLRVSDRVGNEAVYASTNIAKSDTSAAPAPTLGFGSFTSASATGSNVYYNPASAGGFTVTASSSDAESGVASYGYPSLGSGWSNTPSGGYSFTAGATDPTEPNNVTAVNGAGLTSAPTSFTVSADASSPVTTASCNGGPCGGWFTTTPVSVSLTATDGGSGVDRILYSTDGSAPSTAYSGPITVAATTTVKYAAVDKVGNTESTHAQLVQVDTTAPAAPTLGLGAVSGAATVAGGTLYFNPSGTGGFTVMPSATDAESGIDHYTYPSLGSGWSNTAGSYSFATGASDPAEPNNVTASNGATLTSAPTSFTVTADATPPTTSPTCSGGCSGWHTSNPTVTLSATDGGSGVDRILYSTDGTTPSLVYTGPLTLTSTTTVKFAATDKVGNTEPARSQLVQVDTTAPTAPSLAFSPAAGTAVSGTNVFYNPAATGGFTVTASSTDAESGVASYAYPSLGLGWSTTGNGAYTFAAGAFQPSPANVTATNTAGLTSAPTSFTVTSDTTAPATSASCNGGACTGWFASTPVALALSATDAGSGLDRILYSTDGTAPSLLYTAPLTLTATTNLKFAAYDRVGNLEATKTQLIQIDTTAPTAPSLAFSALTNASLTGSTLYFNPAGTGGFTLTPTSTDPESGVASYSYPALGSGWTRAGSAYSYTTGATDP